MPFAAHDYQQDIHWSSIRCVAVNSVGTIESTDCQIRASIRQSYEVRVYDEFVIKGNTAILRCDIIPVFIRDYVLVTNWLTNDGLTIHSNIQNGGRFSVLSTGELVIHSVDAITDSHRQYRCQTKHKLNDEVKVSANSGRIIVTESQSNLLPKITKSLTQVSAIVGQTVELLCSAQGYPPPHVVWYRFNHKSQLLDRLSAIASSDQKFVFNSLSTRLSQIYSSLIIKSVLLDDSSKYVCVCNNSVGQDTSHTQLIVRAPLSVSINPSHLMVGVGDSVELNCSITGAPVGHVIWKMNGKPIVYNNRIKLYNDRSLHIKQIDAIDQAMYQCIVSNDWSSRSSSAEIHVISDGPHFVYTFPPMEPLSPGVDLSLKCSAKGLPLPQIIWTVDGQPITDSWRIRIGDYVSSDSVVNSYINITNVRTDDGGLYKCLAFNGITKALHYNRVVIRGPVFVRKFIHNITVIAGQSLQVDCPANGHPIQSIQWFINDGHQQWHKLPQNHRQKSLTNGTLVVELMDSHTDEHWYRCLVNGSSGSSAHSDVYIEVLVAPVIAPFSVSPNLREGMRQLLTCAVVEGDPPLSIEFLKDDVPVRQLLTTRDDKFSANRIKLMSNNMFSTTLFISNVTADDSGNYTCLASNRVANTSYSTILTVLVPPKWIISPSDTEAIVGQRVVMDCVSSGHSRVWWERSELREGQLRTIISNSHMHSLFNGSLAINDVQLDDEGVYLCQANNGVGTGISKLVTLKVHVGAYFKTKFESQTVRNGQSVWIDCLSYGEQPITISLTKDGMPLDVKQLNNNNNNHNYNNNNNKYQMLRNETNDSLLIRLNIKDTTRADSSLYTCLAYNQYGRDEYNYQLIVQESPDIPNNVMISEITSRTAVMSWIEPYSGNTIITAYRLQYKPSVNSWQSMTDKMIETIAGSDTSFTIRGLKPVTSYDVRLRAENKCGFSSYSEDIHFTTTEEEPSGPPQHIQVFPLSARSLGVSFTAPTLESRNGRIIGYYLGYKSLDSLDSNYMFKKLLISDVSGVVNQRNEVNITSLKPNTKYAVVVQAFNGKGTGPQSEEIIGQTLLMDRPTAPILTIGDVGYDWIEMEWKFPDQGLDDNIGNNNDSLNTITGYYIYWKSHSKQWIEKQLRLKTYSYTSNDLLCGTLYQFYLVAYNAIGKGDASDAIAIKTKGSAPTVPKQVNDFIIVNTTSAVIRLDEWLSNGCPIKEFQLKYKLTKYETEWHKLDAHLWPDETSLEIQALKAGNWYSLFVRAVNDAGSTEQVYQFATLTAQGGTVSPLSEREPPLGFDSITIVIPVICSVIVLSVILCVGLIVVNKRRPQSLMNQNNYNNNSQSIRHHSQQFNCRDDQLLGSAYQLSVLTNDHNQCNLKDSYLENHNCVQSDKQLYFQSPYALSRIDHKMCVPFDGSGGIETSDVDDLSYMSSTGATTQTPGRQPITREHVYEKPFPPKWV
ncbi:cell adhesion molecule Dscam2-like [Oppia nitens]|uniref:cell adhesion molecule Dscam2-like n=1 Tax=Oppia nitens TaxID=1686743 RepID=UPI0023DC6931|nr:cell adhesion molecule Dscam2-like [Oppia nitens]